MCHTGLGPSGMTEHSEGGLGMHVMVQGRKSPTDTKKHRENERTDVSHTTAYCSPDSQAPPRPTKSDSEF